MGALYGFVKVDSEQLPAFDDATFAMRLLEEERVLVVPGSSFNVGYHDHFRVTFLPEAKVISDVFGRIDRLLGSWRRDR